MDPRTTSQAIPGAPNLQDTLPAPAVQDDKLLAAQAVAPWMAPWTEEGKSNNGLDPAPSLIQQLKQQHGDVIELWRHPQDLIWVIGYPPPRAVWQRFQQDIVDEDKRPYALERLARSSVVYPPPDAFDQLLLRRAGLAETYGNSATKIAGLATVADRKKL